LNEWDGSRNATASAASLNHVTLAATNSLIASFRRRPK
jgi:hypothetical protein